MEWIFLFCLITIFLVILMVLLCICLKKKIWRSSKKIGFVLKGSNLSDFLEQASFAFLVGKHQGKEIVLTEYPPSSSSLFPMLKHYKKMPSKNFELTICNPSSIQEIPNEEKNILIQSSRANGQLFEKHKYELYSFFLGNENLRLHIFKKYPLWKRAYVIHYDGWQDRDYVMKCVRRIRSKEYDAFFYILDNSHTLNLDYSFSIQTNSDLECLYVMALCQRGGIFSQSKLSWWGSLFNPGTIYRKSISQQPSSYDCFDTLVFRACKEPAGIFDICGKILQIPDFRKKRIQAEIDAQQNKKGDYTLHDIYMEFCKKNNSSIPPETLVQQELAVESQFIFPNIKLASQLKQGDIIVSDMYLSKEQLYHILGKTSFQMDMVLTSIGKDQGFLPSQCNIYVSNGGKHTGMIWNQVVEPVSIHYGDSIHSDVEQPLRFDKIKKTNHISDCIEYTRLEKEALQHNNELVALIMRKTRLMNPYPENSIFYHIYHQQSQHNIPLLIMVAAWCSQQKAKKIGFMLRDTFYLKSFFQILFPKIECLYIQASRNALLFGSEETVQNLKHEISQCDFILDFQGTGKSFKHFIKRSGIKPVPLFMVTIAGYLLYEKDTVKKILFHDELLHNDFIERLNPSPFGSFLDITTKGNKRCGLDHSIDFIACIQIAFGQAVEALQLLQPYYSPVSFNLNFSKLLYSQCDKNVVNFSEHKSNHDVNHFYIQPNNQFFISYGTLDFSGQSILVENLYSNIFHSAKVFTPLSIQSIPGYKRELYSKKYNQFNHHSEHKRGASHSFWRWKPFIINYQLSLLEEGDILFYQDVNVFKYPSLLTDACEKITSLNNDLLEKMPFSILVGSEQCHLTLKNFCKREAFVKMNVSFERFKDFPLFQGNRIIIRKNAVSCFIIQEWLKNCLDDELLLPGETDPYGGWHTHDQAILQLTICKYLQEKNFTSYPLVYIKNKRYRPDCISFGEFVW